MSPNPELKLAGGVASSLECCGGGVREKQGPMTGTLTHRRSQYGQTTQTDNFPCLNPRYPRMTDEGLRIESFQNWPGHTVATAPELAAAGLYYQGWSDKTSCFYCGGGLHNWEYNDDPFEEHAKWYPECEFLLREKGPEYVANITARQQGRNGIINVRENTGGNLRNLRNVRVVSNGGSVTITQNNQPPIRVATSSTGRPNAYQRPSLNDRVQEAMRHEFTAQMQQFGFTNDRIKKTLERKLLNSEEDMFESLSDFLDALELVDNNEEENHGRGHSIAAAATNIPVAIAQQTGTTESPSTSTVEQRIKTMQDERRCKICLDQERSCVFEPCGHLCSCIACGSRVRDCPICRRRIQRILKVYSS